MSDKISDKDLLDELKRITLELGREPKRNEIDDLSKFSHNAYARAFGSFANAILQMGGIPKYIRNCTKEDVISEIRRIFLETGKIPSVKIFDEKAKMSYRTAKNLIKDQKWSSLLKEANLLNSIE